MLAEDLCRSFACSACHDGLTNCDVKRNRVSFIGCMLHQSRPYVKPVSLMQSFSGAPADRDNVLSQDDGEGSIGLLYLMIFQVEQ